MVCSIDREIKSIKLVNTLYIPDLSIHLLSLAIISMMSKRYHFIKTDKFVFI